MTTRARDDSINSSGETVVDNDEGYVNASVDLEHGGVKANGQPRSGGASMAASVQHEKKPGLGGGAGEKAQEENDPDLVDWDGPEDPLNPLNTKGWRKWLLIFIVGSATLCTTCASSMVASTYTGMMEEFDISHEVATLALTL